MSRRGSRWRRSIVDGLDRLIEVDEPNSTPASAGPCPVVGDAVWVTTYSYDALNNLTLVQQEGNDPSSANWRTRTFVYNSLSQLTQASNPESGTVNYGYDGDGNLIAKTDARGVTTTYAYDALQRLTQKSYSDGTPNLSFSYDVAPSWMSDLTNVVGRLVEAKNQYAGSSGSTTASSVVNSYDAVGRIVRQWQQTPSTSSGGYFVYHSYDLAGNPISSTNAAGVTISYRYDAAARPTSVTSSLIDAQPLRANMPETSLVPLFNEQGEKEKGKDEQHIERVGFWGLGCHGTERRRA